MSEMCYLPNAILSAFLNTLHAFCPSIDILLRGHYHVIPQPAAFVLLDSLATIHPHSTKFIFSRNLELPFPRQRQNECPQQDRGHEPIPSKAIRARDQHRWRSL